MATGVTDLGNGLGYIYVVNPNGTDIEYNIPNDANGEREAKLLAAQSYSVSTNKRAYGIITINAVTGSGTIRPININGVDQLNANIAYAAGPTADIAVDVAAGINSFAPASGPDYEAVAINNKVYVYGPINSGASLNGLAISVTDTGNITITTTDIDYGSDASTVYDQASGYRFYLDADYDASCSCSGQGTAVPGDLSNALEITNYIVPRPLNTSLDTQEVTISTSGAASVTRISAITHVVIDTFAAAATDDLDNLLLNDSAENDIIVLWGASAARVTTITSAGNINLVNAFSTADLDTAIILRYNTGTFYEIGRSGGNYVPTAASFRTNSFPFLTSGAQGRNTLAPADNTIVNLVANTNKTNERIDGSATLSTGNYQVTLDTTGIVDGDEFNFNYYGLVTVGAFAVIIGGVTLTAAEALYGGVNLKFVASGGSWVAIGRSYDVNVYPIQTANLGASQVTVAKLATELQYELIVSDVSFETSEQGDFKVKMPFAGTLNEIYGIATKAIAATNSGTITPKNNGGTTMTGGIMTFAASDAIGTAYTTTPTANNTFVAGDILSFTTLKGNAGGKVKLSIKVTRS